MCLVVRFHECIKFVDWSEENWARSEVCDLCGSNSAPHFYDKNLMGSETTHRCGRSLSRSDEVHSHVGLKQLEPLCHKSGKYVFRTTFFEVHTKGFHYDCEVVVLTDANVLSSTVP